jgi:kynureninase
MCYLVMNVYQFVVDKKRIVPSEECIYLCGQSLGLMPKRTITYMAQFMNDWATL